MLGRRSKLVLYLIPWILVGVILLSIPALVAPITENALTTNPSGKTNPTTLGTNSTTSNQIRFSGVNGSVTTELARNVTFTLTSSYPTNITIVAYSGNVNALTITSTSPANVTITSKPSNSQTMTSASLASNVPDFVLRLSLVLAPAIVLSSLGMVRVRR